MSRKIDECVRIKDDVFLKVVLIQSEYAEIAVSDRDAKTRVYTLKVGQKICLPHQSEVYLIRIGKDSVRLGFETPRPADVQRITDH